MNQDSERKAFEAWYAMHAFNYQQDPIGSAECGRQWQAWQAGKERAALTGQEPVAYRIEHRPDRYMFMEAKHYEYNKFMYPEARIMPLYAAQPSPEPMTDEQIHTLSESASALYGMNMDADRLSVELRAIIAQARGEK